VVEIKSPTNFRVPAVDATTLQLELSRQIKLTLVVAAPAFVDRRSILNRPAPGRSAR
jgi:hypothetical protein